MAAGGTSLKLNGRGARKSESVWNDSGPPSSNGTFKHVKQFSGTGGGCSTLFTAPAWQQQAAGMGGQRLRHAQALGRRLGGRRPVHGL